MIPLLRQLILLSFLVELSLFAEHPPAPGKGDVDAFFEKLNMPPTNQIRENLGGGILTSSFGTLIDAGRAVTIQTNGSILIAGRENRTAAAPVTNNDFLVSRYFPDGEVDTGFGVSGAKSIDFGKGDIAHGIFFQTDGNIVVLGKGDVTTDGYADFAVARLTTTGSLDTSFSTDGMALTSIGEVSDIARAGLVATDGKLIIAGYRYTSGTTKYDAAIVRYNTNGTLDTSFFTNGKAVAALVASDNLFFSVKLQANGNLVGAGPSYNGSNWDFAIARLDTSGALDTSFNTSGKLSFSITSGGADLANGLAISSTGQFLIAGSTNNGTNLDFAIARVNTNGTLDTSFNTIGKVATTIGTGNDAAFGIGIQTDGNPIAAGYSSNGTNNDFAIVRFSANGTLDATFNATGKATTSLSTSDDVAQTIIMLDENFFIGGRVTNAAGNFDFGLARYQTDGTLGSSATLDQSFGP